MKKLSPVAHGILDYFTVLFLLVSPSLFEMQYSGSEFSYALASYTPGTHIIYEVSRQEFLKSYRYGLMG